MKKLLFIVTIISLVACKNETHDFTLKGSIKGLKKGKVYLQKQQDSILITIDSVDISGQPSFELHSSLTEPEVLFLKLDKNDNDDGIIPFFADKGITEIQTTLKNFNFDAKVSGSKQQVLLDEYLVMMSKFNDKNLDLIKENFESKKENDTLSFDFESEYNSLLKRKYLYTINFAVNNNDSEVSPYLALTEIPRTSVKYLETIYDALEESIKTSLYGKELKTVIEKRKQEEN